MEQNAIAAMFMTLIIGLVVVGTILGVGALVLSNVQNITVTQYMMASYGACLTSNASNTTCTLPTGYVIPAYSGNWTMGNANSLTANYSDGNLATFPICGNTTNNDVQCNATWSFRNSNASLSGASSILVTVYNLTGTGAYTNYTVTLPDACTYNGGSPLYFTVIRAVKNTSTSALTYYCNSTAGWQTLATYSNATATVATGWYPLGSEPWISWSVYNGTVQTPDSVAATFQPISSSLNASNTLGGWIGTVVIAAIAGIILLVVFAIARILGGKTDV